MLFVLNTKAYLTKAAEVAPLRKAAALLAKAGHDVALALPLALMPDSLRDGVALAAQDVSVEGPGAHTGEATAEALAGAGVSYVIVGHSERRKAGETDTEVAAKLARVLSVGMTPVLCVGELARDDDGRYLEEVTVQLVSALSGLSEKDRAKVVVAYEPVWAISSAGGARPLTPDELAEAALFVRSVLAERFSPELAKKTRVLYGGSVTAEEVPGYVSTGRVQGFLVGRASASPESLAALAAALS